MSELRLFIPIGKVDEAARTVYGTLTEETPDKSGELFDYASGKPAVQAWSDEINAASKGKSKGNVRAMHGNIAAGKFTDIVYDDANKRIEGAAKIVDDDEWEKVLAGVYTGFSIGGAYTKRWQDPNNPSIWRFTPKLSEVSLVDNPCVPTATFEYIKADGSVEMRKFTPSHKEDSMDPKALADAREALAKGTATDEHKALIATADAELLKAAQDADAKGTATDEQKALLTKVAADAKPALVKDGKAVKPQVEPEQGFRATDGSFHLKKDDARRRNLEIEAQARLAPALSQMDELLKAAKKPAEDDDEEREGDSEEEKKAKKERREEKAKKTEKEKAEKDDAEMAAKKKEEEAEKKKKEEADKAAADSLGKKDYSDKEREEMAASGEAMEDGSYPIKTKKDLENAIQAYGRAKDKAKAKAHIKARAKALGAEDMLPEEWTGKKKEKAVPKGELAKGLHQVGWLAHMLNELTNFQECVEMEQYFEGDKDSELPAKLKSIVSEMCELLVTLVEEETQELVDDNEDTDVEILEMAAGLPVGHPEAIAKRVRIKAAPLSKSDSKTECAAGELLVKFAEALEKAGARHSKADAERVQALQDHADETMKCFGAMAEKCADMHKAAGNAKNTAMDLGAKGQRYEEDDDSAQKMTKATLDTLSESKVMVAALTQVISKMDNTLTEATGVMKRQTASIEKLENEKSELAERVATLEAQPMPGKGSLRAFSKTQDGGTGDGKARAEFEAALEKMTPDERTIELIKLAQKNPLPA
jgi:hypothetical protein